MTPFRTILVATNFDGTSNSALERALALATRLESKVILLHVASMPPLYYAAYAEGLAWPTEELEGSARQALDRAVVAAKTRYEKVEGVLSVGNPREKIVEVAVERHADVIVMGTHGRRGIQRALLGSVAEAVVRSSPVPVLTVST